MKKILSLLLVISMLLSFASCQSSLGKAGETKTTEAPLSATEETSETKNETVDNTPIVYPEGFSVGFGREIVTPPSGTGLAGYGGTDRVSKSVLDDLKLTCTAICDGENVVLLYSTDLTKMGGGIAEVAKKQLNQAYGIPAENIMFNATHTHSAPGFSTSNFAGAKKYLPLYYAAVVKTAGDALRDLEEASALYGTGNTVELNYVRRYISLIDGSPVSKNVSYGQDPTKVAHESKPDTELQIIKFDRATKKDVILCNWQCHPTGPGGEKNYEVSADWIGSLRDSVEQEADVLFSFHQGAAGNLAQGGKIQGDKSWGGSLYVEHGKEIAKVALSVMQNLTPVQTGKIQARRFVLTAEYKEEILSGKQQKLYSSQIDLGAITMGEIAFALCTGEPHDTMGVTVKDSSPYKATFFCGYTNGDNGYIPSAFAYPNKGYEVESTNYAPGTGEAIVAELLKNLGEMHAAQ